jgi:peptidoglycan/LPS O-acetylase OafA/YrhL
MIQAMNYRPDIDGLRAIAVLGVLWYHIDPAVLGGGFVGVDVFFVISGFLITSLIIKDLETGSFSIARFYERRIRRILPALFCMIAACCVAAWFILLPDDYLDFAKSAKYAAISLPNLYFLREIRDYFSPGVERFPLLHTWSLGVEEQFYIAFPLLLTLLFRHVGKPRIRIAVVSVVLIASLVAAVLTVPRHPEKAFFLLHYRAWELMLGALIAMAKPRLRSVGMNHALGAAGLVMILLAMVLYTANTAFPGASAVPPCLGAGLVILTGGDKRVITARLLAWRPLVFIGLISYSVYLWHWPLIVFARYAGMRESLPAAALLGAISLVAGALSWRFIEQPFRKPITGTRPMVFAAWALTCVLLIGFWHAARWSQGFAARYSADVLRVLDYKEWATAYRNNAAKKFKPEESPVYGARNVTPDIAVWGDSHARALLPVLDEMAKRRGRALRHFGMNGVPPVVGATPLDIGNPQKTSEYSARTLALLTRDPSLRTVVLISRWSLPGTARCDGGSGATFSFHEQSFKTRELMDSYYIARLRETIQLLLDSGKRVVIVEPVTMAPFNVPDTFARMLNDGHEPDISVDCPQQEIGNQLILQAFDQLAPSPLLVRIKPSQKLVHDGQLLLWHERKPLYADQSHLSTAGAWFIEDLLADAFTP